jgi:carbamoylphosphate synthase large subunit
MAGDMERLLLVSGAGSGGTNNLIGSLRERDAGGVFIVGYHTDRFILKKSPADRNYVVPPPTHPRFADTLGRIVEKERIDLIIPTQDVDVLGLTRCEGAIAARVFLPSRSTIERCQDKYELTSLLRARKIPAPETYPIASLDEIDESFHRLGSPSRAWCRIRVGSGSRGAIPVGSVEQARSWITYWQQMRGVPVSSFTLCEYLPGRDFLCQSIWKDGTLILARTFERLSYFDGSNRASGVSSFSALAKTVYELQVFEVCRQAVLAVDGNASGLFSIDLKANTEGVPCVTEINAGRFFIGMTSFDRVCKHNMARTYVSLALGEPVDLRDEYDVAADYYLVRDLDTLPRVFHADEMFEGIEELQ